MNGGIKSNPILACVLVCLQIILLKYTDYAWVAELIQIFVAVSVTVSFLVMGSAMKHTSTSLLEPRLLYRTVLYTLE